MRHGTTTLEKKANTEILFSDRFQKIYCKISQRVHLRLAIMSFNCCVCDTEIRDPGGADLRGHLSRGMSCEGAEQRRPCGCTGGCL